MGLQQHRTLIAYTWSDSEIKEAQEVLNKIAVLLDLENVEYVKILGVAANGGGSVVIGPDGSKENWPQSDKAKSLRDQFWIWLTSRVSWSYALVEFGELGNKVLYGR